MNNQIDNKSECGFSLTSTTPAFYNLQNTDDFSSELVLVFPYRKPGGGIPLTNPVHTQPVTDGVVDDKLKKFFELIEKIIQKILLRLPKQNLTYDILDTEKSSKNKLLVLQEKQRQMKIGEIWQEVLGNYDGFINLKIGHETGLDILSHTKKIAIELKNRTNTDNSSSKKYNLYKLANFKKKNPEYVCIYANINANTEKKTLTGSKKKILHNGVELEHQIGYEFLTFILGDNTDKIIEFVKDTIDKNIQNYNNFINDSPICFANSTGTAFPICLY